MQFPQWVYGATVPFDYYHIATFCILPYSEKQENVSVCWYVCVCVCRRYPTCHSNRIGLAHSHTIPDPPQGPYALRSVVIGRNDYQGERCACPIAIGLAGNVEAEWYTRRPINTARHREERCRSVRETENQRLALSAFGTVTNSPRLA